MPEVKLPTTEEVDEFEWALKNIRLLPAFAGLIAGCREAVRLEAENARLKGQVERLRPALQYELAEHPNGRIARCGCESCRALRDTAPAKEKTDDEVR